MTTENLIILFIVYTVFYNFLIALAIRIFTGAWPLMPIWNLIGSTGKRYLKRFLEYLGIKNFATLKEGL